jgi:hypothetical protein
MVMSSRYNGKGPKFRPRSLVIKKLLLGPACMHVDLVKHLFLLL